MHRQVCSVKERGWIIHSSFFCVPRALPYALLAICRIIFRASWLLHAFEKGSVTTKKCSGTTAR